MQAFIVLANAASPSITLDYNRLVYTPALSGVTVVPNKAPRRKALTDEPVRLSVRIQGESGYGDQLRLSEHPDFTPDFDQGWDGRKLYGVEAAPQLYVLGADKLAIAALPELEGTPVGLKAGEADDTYTLTFEYDGAEPLYLLDTYMNTYARVQTGSTYTFSTPDKYEHSRFLLTRRMPQTPTGMEPSAISFQHSDTKKLLMNEQLYILHQGKLYSLDGRMIRFH
jgi:hypothetical protein